jgi:hypothetical protein
VRQLAHGRGSFEPCCGAWRGSCGVVPPARHDGTRADPLNRSSSRVPGRRAPVPRGSSPESRNRCLANIMKRVEWDLPAAVHGESLQRATAKNPCNFAPLREYSQRTQTPLTPPGPLQQDARASAVGVALLPTETSLGSHPIGTQSERSGHCSFERLPQALSGHCRRGARRGGQGRLFNAQGEPHMASTSALRR